MIITSLQEKRLAQEITDIEKDTGYKLRVLAQNYPDTPGTYTTIDVELSPDLIKLFQKYNG